MFKISMFRKHIQGLEDLLPYAFFVSEGDILNKSGSLSACFDYMGDDLDSCDDEELNALQTRLNQALMKMDSSWMIQIDVIRRSIEEYIKPEESMFPEPTSFVIDEERRARYNQRNLHFSNKYYITMTYMPPDDAETKFDEILKDKNKNKGKVMRQLEEVGYIMHLKRFKLALINFQDSVRELKLRKLNSEEFLSFIYHCMTGNSHGVKLPKTVMYLDHILGRVGDLHNTLTPKIGNKYFRALTIVDAPDDSYVSILDNLTKQQIEYRWNKRFICLSAKDADTLLKSRRKLWWQKRRSAMDLGKEAATGQEASGWRNEDSEEMAYSVNGAIKRNNMGRERYGFYTSTLIAFHEDQRVLDDHMRTLKKAVEDKLFIAHLEDMHLTQVYNGSLPAVDYANIRMTLISTNNLADMFPSTSVWTGLDRNPNPIFVERGINNPPMMYGVTAGATPFKMSLHTSDASHTIIFGPPRTGKDVLMNTMAAQALRYNQARIFMLDNGNGAIQLCHGVGGVDYDITAKNRISFQPLRNLETAEDLDCARAFIKVIAALKMPRPENANPDNVLTKKQEDTLNTALNNLSQRPVNERSLSKLQTLLGADKELFDTVTYYTRFGPMGDLFDGDNENISITESHFTRYEMSYLLTQYKDEALVPFLVYFINRLKIYLLPRKYPVFLFMNEIWQVLANKKFMPYLEDLLRTGGKNNLTVILATQNTTDIINSQLASVLISACPTKIYLPDPTAKTSYMRTGYLGLGLNQRQIDIVSSSTPKKQYYYTSPLGRQNFELDICDFTKCLVGEHDPELARKVYAEHGDKFTYHWVKYFAHKHNNKNLHEWAEYWMGAYQKFNSKYQEFNNGEY